jgi:hypothetical protein
VSAELIAIADIERMANAFVKSNFFGVKTVEQAVALMLISQAEGLHPATAARDYNVIQGRPALKADAMLARFQHAGGSVQWTELTDKRVAATFSHPQGGSVTIDWDMARAKAAGLDGKDNYKKWPRQMLRARCISEGIRTVYPGVLSGMYTPEEVQDFDNKTAPEPIQDAVVVEAKPAGNGHDKAAGETKTAGNGHDKAAGEFKAAVKREWEWFTQHATTDILTSILGKYGVEKTSELSTDQRKQFMLDIARAKVDVQKAHAVADKLGMDGESAAIDEPAPAQVEAEFEEAKI